MRYKVQNWQLTNRTLGNTIVMKKVCRDYFDLDHFDNQATIKLKEFFFLPPFKEGIGNLYIAHKWHLIIMI